MTLVAFSVQKVNAQSAVAVGSNGVYGYAYRAESQRAAVFRALRECEARGGVNVHIVASTFSPGFSAVAYWRESSGRWAIGCSLGRGTRYEAIQRSIDECLAAGGFNPRIVASWID
jgi:Domain of unknown function (DUF4189)